MNDDAKNMTGIFKFRATKKKLEHYITEQLATIHFSKFSSGQKNCEFDIHVVVPDFG